MSLNIPCPEYALLILVLVKFGPPAKTIFVNSMLPTGAAGVDRGPLVFPRLKSVVDWYAPSRTVPPAELDPTIAILLRSALGH